ncbi:MAG: ribbon-helix-helix protein, CopG family [Candidatus Scalindua sp.]
MVRINAILPEDTIKKIDDIAKAAKKSRSKILREAADKIIEEYETLKAEQIKRDKIKQAIKTQDKLREKSGKWNGISEVRKWRERKN